MSSGVLRRCSTGRVSCAVAPLSYNESNFHADMEACLEFLEHKDFGFVHQILHYRRMLEGSLTAYSQKLNTYLYGQMQALVSYGPKYLTDEN